MAKMSGFQTAPPVSSCPSRLFHGLLLTVSVPFEEDEKDPSVWFLDHNYVETMNDMFRKVNGMFASTIYYRLKATDLAKGYLTCVLYSNQPRSAWLDGIIADPSCALLISRS